MLEQASGEDVDAASYGSPSPRSACQPSPGGRATAPGPLVTYGLQHVLSMYAGVVAPPLIVGTALKVPFPDIALLISASLLMSGLATLLQTLGVWKIGAQLPIVQGTSFASVATMLAIGGTHGGGYDGLRTIYGAVIVAGLVGFLFAPFFSQLLRFFPPVVTGSVITIIGTSLVPVAIGWARGTPNTPDYGSPRNIALAAVTLLLTMLVYFRRRDEAVPIAAAAPPPASGSVAPPIGSK